MSDLESKTLAELHRLAAEAGIERFRMLRREELIERLGGNGEGESTDSDEDAGRGEAGGSEDDPGRDESTDSDEDAVDAGRDESGSSEADPGWDESSGPRRSRSRRSRSRRRSRSGGDGERSGDHDRRSGGRGDDHEPEEDAGDGRGHDEPTEPELTEITGVLEILHRGSGVIRGEGAPPAGVHVSPAQIRRCELRAGDEVAGPVRPARRGERRPSLVRVEKVNGEPPVDERSPRFDSLTPVPSKRLIPLSPHGDDVLARAVDLLVPLAFGQRVLVESQPRSGRTSLLQALARAVGAGAAETSVLVLLVDERPEEVTSWQRGAPEAEIVAAPADLDAHEQVKIAERALTRAKRKAESGDDVVLLIDSLTRLGNAYGDAGQVKPFFGVGRELEEEGAGSVTVVATALVGAPGDQSVLDAVRGSQNATLRLDAARAASGITPSLDISSSVTADYEGLLGPEGAEAVMRLRTELDQLDSARAASRLAELIRGTESNEELRRNL